MSLFLFILELGGIVVSFKKSIHSISMKVIATSGIAIIIINILMSLLLTQLITQVTKDNFKTRGYEVLSAISTNLVPDDIHTILSLNNMTNDTYLSLHDYLHRAKENVSVTYLYIKYFDDNQDSYYLVDADPMDSADYCYLGLKEEFAQDDYNALTQGNYTASEFYKTDLWGELMTIELPLFDSNNQFVGCLCADFSANDVLVTQHALNLKIYAILLILIIPELIFIYLSIGRLVGKSIRQLDHMIEIIANFDFTDQTLGNSLLNRKDELGKMTRKINMMRQKLTEKAHITIENTQSMANAIEQVHVKLKHSNAANQEITSSLNDFAAGINEQVADNNTSFELLTLLSEKIENLTGQIDTLNTLTTSMQQATAKSEHAIAHLDTQFSANKIHAKQLEEKVHHLVLKSQEIQGIIETVNAITKQTNLLALNASIEAARAGEAGKGFSVVAENIRSLSESEFKSTKEIQEIVHLILADIQDVSSFLATFIENNVVVNETALKVSRRFEKTENKFSEMVHIIDELNAITQSIYEYKEQVYEMTTSSTAKIQEYSAISEEIAASAEKQNQISEAIYNMSKTLTTLSDQLKITVEEYKL